MHITVLWKQSLKLCKPSTIKLFTLLTLKTMRDALCILMAWWVMLPLIVIFVLYGACLIGVLSSYGLIGLIGVSMDAAKSILNILFVLAARPSIDLKNFAYFKKNIGKSIWMLIEFLIIWILFALVVFLFIGFDRHWWLVGPLYYLLIVTQTLGLLFYLDRTEGPWRAYARGFRMVWYNMPVLITYGLSFVFSLLIPVAGIFVIASLLYLVFPTMAYSYSLLYGILTFCAKIFINFASICLMTNLYVKLAYDDRYALCFSESKPNSEL